MQVHWAYFGCGKEAEEQLQRCWEDEQRRLHSRLDALADEPAELEIVASRQDEPPPWQIQSALHLPARTVVVRAAQNAPDRALENVVSGLIDEIDRLAEQPEQVTRRREGLHGIVPILGQCRQEGRSDVFFSWLAPAVASLAAHVRRELRIRELESGLGTGQIVPADVLNEVFVRAYDEFERRPGKLPLDLWLLQLAEEVLEQSSRTLAEESLDEQVRKPSTEARESSRDSWTEWATSSETIELGELLPGMPAADKWDTLDLETKKVQTDRMLARVPRQQRQALILNTVYGFSPAELADFQNRSEEDVLADVGGGTTLAGALLPRRVSAGGGRATRAPGAAREPTRDSVDRRLRR
jgi:DNA-directed RNA polymerase specialized sigma24 family protein